MANASELTKLLKLSGILKYQEQNDGTIDVLEARPFSINSFSRKRSCVRIHESLVENGTLKVKFGNIINSTDFYCKGAQLTSFKNCPDKVDGTFMCTDNPIRSLEGIPAVTSSIVMNLLPLESLIGINDFVKETKTLFFNAKKIKRGGLGIALISKIQDISMSTEPFKIIQDCIKNETSIFECQEKLLEMGFEEFAQL